MKNGPLDMRMGRDQLLKAEDIVNQWDEQEMAEIFMKYGDERFSRRIAKAIVRRRNTEPILTTQDLADTVIQAIPEMNRYTENIHPATRVFQALRIVVNDELGALRTGLQGALERLRPNGRIAVLSYHSLEHRIVKELFKNFTGVNAGPPGTPELQVNQRSRGRVLTRKSIRPCAAEREQNPRCRSAQLRVLERYLKIDFIFIYVCLHAQACKWGIHLCSSIINLLLFLSREAWWMFLSKKGGNDRFHQIMKLSAVCDYARGVCYGFFSYG